MQIYAKALTGLQLLLLPLLDSLFAAAPAIKKFLPAFYAHQSPQM